jgi:hypothetical protein
MTSTSFIHLSVEHDSEAMPLSEQQHGHGSLSGLQALSNALSPFPTITTDRELAISPFLPGFFFIHRSTFVGRKSCFLKHDCSLLYQVIKMIIFKALQFQEEPQLLLEQILSLSCND